jgi:Integrase zinc binding domain/RNase H-like domain found in reverse transcriptase
MLAIVTAFKEWRIYLEGAQHQITILSDHQNLQHFMTTKTFTHQQCRWAELLSGYDFVIGFRPGKQSGKPDALSRRSDFYFEGEKDFVPTTKDRKFLNMKHFLTSITTVSIEDTELLNQIKRGYSDDPEISKILRCLEDSEYPRSREIKSKISNYTLKNRVILYNKAIYVPSGEIIKDDIKLQILKQYHDSPVSGHFGQAKTFELVSRNFYWPRIRKFINHYVESCDICARSKTSRHKPYSSLQPLPIPDKPWSSIAMDFIVELPESNGYQTILTVVDRLTKMAHFIPATYEINAKETARISNLPLWIRLLEFLHWERLAR